jgi:3-hydroxybutyryl-CoA dehydrogenase
MQLVVLGNDSQVEELLNNRGNNQIDLTVISTVQELTIYKHADALIDLLFDGSSERIELLREFSRGVVIINSVVDTLQKIGAPFTRINGWPGFLRRPIVEASTNDMNVKNSVQNIFSCLGKDLEWLPDTPGFVTARVIAMIINEAWFALDEDISTAEEIDAAMRLGTNYPHGPFEWCEKIGARNVHDLLQELAKMDRRYEPSTLLTKHAID